MPGGLLWRQTRRFALSGALVTAFHVVVAASLIRVLQAPPALANAMAFSLATVLSYTVNTLWSFSRPLQGIALIRFAAVSLLGLALTVAIAALAHSHGLSYWAGIAGVVCTVPPVTFLLHKAWTYREEGASGLASWGDAGSWLAVLNGMVMFLATTRGAILDPRNTDWLMRSPDPATSFLGWRFFRQSAVFQLPFGANPGYGMEMGSSVVFTDSIPLLALLFKPFTGLLPDMFQYFGLWLLLSFVLQSLLAYTLLRRFSQDRWLALIGSGFFVLAPVYLARVEGHFALFGQWVVLAALYLYFARRCSLLSWTLLLGISALIHFYLLAMVGVLWAGDLWQRRWRKDITTAQAATYLLTGAAVTLIIMWCAGYFMIGHAIGQPGFGILRMNLLSVIDPNELGSLLLPDQPGAASEFEGFNYLGLGIILLALVAGYALLRKRGEAPIDHRSIVPLLCISLGLTVLALSNRVAVGHLELFTYEIPDFLKPGTDLLRSSGRMFWPVYYLIYLAVLVFIFRRFSRRAAICVCAAMLAVQVADSAALLRYYSNGFASAPAWSSPLKSPLWSELGTRYKRVVYVMPSNAPDKFLPWAAFAADHGMAVNIGYFARVNPEKLTAMRNDLETAVLRNLLEPGILYVFESDALWRLASAHSRPGDVVAVVDGFRIIARP
jgi:putative flippase GtrA